MMSSTMSLFLITCACLVVLMFLYFMSHVHEVTHPLALIIICSMTFLYSWRYVGARTWQKTSIALLASAATGLVSYAYWPRKNESVVYVAAERGTNGPKRQESVKTNRPCSQSFCVTPGQRENLTSQNCAMHTRNLHSSLKRHADGVSNAMDRVCIRFSRFDCVSCNGDCVEAKESRCGAEGVQEMKRDSRDKPPDQLWQLSEAELIRSWSS